jgi:hypothetical protein
MHRDASQHEYNDDNPTLTFQQVFDGYVQGHESFFYLDDRIPTLGEVRGKIVVVRRFSLDSNTPRGLSPDPWTDNATFAVGPYNGTDGKPITFQIQDQYQPPLNPFDPLGVKWSAVKALLDQAQSDTSSTWYINEASGEVPLASGGPPFFLTPTQVAEGDSPTLQGIKSRLYNYLVASSFANRLGTLLMDFPDDTLIGTIIGLNMPATSGQIVQQPTA